MLKPDRGVPVMSEDIGARLDALEAEIRQIRSQLTLHDSAIQSLAGLTTDLLELARLNERRANEDRAVMREIQNEVRGILQYLFNQQRNNGSGGSGGSR